jgi:hypothetical protein
LTVRSERPEAECCEGGCKGRLSRIVRAEDYLKRCDETLDDRRASNLRGEWLDVGSQRIGLVWLHARQEYFTRAADHNFGFSHWVKSHQEAKKAR